MVSNNKARFLAGTFAALLAVAVAGPARAQYQSSVPYQGDQTWEGDAPYDVEEDGAYVDDGYAAPGVEEYVVADPYPVYGYTVACDGGYFVFGAPVFRGGHYFRSRRFVRSHVYRGGGSYGRWGDGHRTYAYGGHGSYERYRGYGGSRTYGGSPSYSYHRGSPSYGGSRTYSGSRGSDGSRGHDGWRSHDGSGRWGGGDRGRDHRSGR